MSARSAIARPLAVVHLDAAGGEALGDQARSARFLERQLGVRVQVAPQVAELVVIAADGLDGTRHVGWTRSRGSTA